MTRNKEMFLKLAEKIRKIPKCYDQGTWGEPAENQGFTLEEVPCGTVACIAGHACLLGGYFPTTYRGRTTYFEVNPEPGMPNNHPNSLMTLRVAKELLGLDLREARILFDETWEPYINGELVTVPEALEAYANGAEIE